MYLCHHIIYNILKYVKITGSSKSILKKKKDFLPSSRSIVFNRYTLVLMSCRNEFTTVLIEMLIIWNDIKVIEWTWFLYWKFQREIILQKDTISILTIYKITKWHKTEKTVVGVTVHDQSLVILYLYQVSWNDLKPYQSYRADTISMPEIKKGNNSANNVSGVTTFNLCKMAGHALYCTKFCEII